MPDTAPVHTRHGSNIGQPLTRREGVLKVTGGARYAADNHPPGMLFAVMATSSIARGRITGLDTADAHAHPGVVEVMTSANAPSLARHPDNTDEPFMYKLDLLQDDRIRYANQPIAVVIAKTLEAATEGAALINASYAAEPARIGLDATERFVQGGWCRRAAECRQGRCGSRSRRRREARRGGLRDRGAVSQRDGATRGRCGVDGNRLVLDTLSQGLSVAQVRLAGLFGIDPADIHIRSPFLGGGFGSKGALWAPQVLGVMAARLVGRPVKLVTRREQMFGPVGHRAQTRQTCG